MYKEFECPHCGDKFTLKMIVECLEKQTFRSEEEAKQYILNNIHIRTLSEDELPELNIEPR